MDWIKAHFECSLDHALLVLRERVKADIEEWQTQAAADAKINITIDGMRTVISKDKHMGVGPWVTFERAENFVLVRRGPRLRMDESQVESSKLIPTVNFEGECRFRLAEQELEFWQASRFILESVLFG